MFVAVTAMAAAACGAGAHPADDSQTLAVGTEGDAPEDDRAPSALASQQRSASLLADAARLARLDASESLRVTDLGDVLVQSIGVIGLDAERRPFLAAGRGLPAVSVRVDGDFILAAGMIYSAVGVVEGPLRRAEVDDEGNLRGAEYQGAVVLVSRGVTPFRVIGRLLESAGAAAVIIHNNRPGLLYGTLSQPSGIPVVAVTQETGDDLAERLDGGDAHAVVDVSPPSRSFQGANVIGHRAGPLRRQIIVATPADAPSNASADGGNADGLALLLELARYADELNPRHSISFIVFDATHQGYVGSRWYLAHLSDDERASIAAVLIFDRPGRSGALQLGASPMLEPLIDARLSADGHDLRTTPGFGVGRGDHDVFSARGIPYVFLAGSGAGEIAAEPLLRAFQIAASTLQVLDDLDPTTTN